MGGRDHTEKWSNGETTASGDCSARQTRSGSGTVKRAETQSHRTGCVAFPCALHRSAPGRPCRPAVARYPPLWSVLRVIPLPPSPPFPPGVTARASPFANARLLRASGESGGDCERVLAGIGGRGPVAQRIFRRADVVVGLRVGGPQLERVLARADAVLVAVRLVLREAERQPALRRGPVLAQSASPAGRVAVRSWTSACASASAGLNSTARWANSRASSVLPTDFSQRAKNV